MYKVASTQIFFFYPLETIMDRIKMYSQYSERHNDSDAEQFVTDDEQDLIIVEAEKALSRIFQVAVKLSKGIADSLWANRDFSITGVNYGSSFLFRLNNYQGYNPNVLPIVDSCIEKLWTNMVLAKWFLLKGKNDLYKSEMMDQGNLLVAYNNSLTELYKPFIASVTPDYSLIEVEVDDDTNEVIEETATTTTMTDPLYYDTFASFPESGATDTTYVDKSTGTQYYWNGTAYAAFNAPVQSYSVEFEAVSAVVVEHNLNKMRPNVVMTDSDGNDWEVDYEPIDANSGTVEWEGNKTGTLYFS